MVRTIEVLVSSWSRVVSLSLFPPSLYSPFVDNNDTRTYRWLDACWERERKRDRYAYLTQQLVKSAHLQWFPKLQQPKQIRLKTIAPPILPIAHQKNLTKKSQIIYKYSSHPFINARSSHVVTYLRLMENIEIQSHAASCEIINWPHNSHSTRLSTPYISLHSVLGVPITRTTFLVR